MYRDHLSEGIEGSNGQALSSDLRQTVAGPFVAYRGARLEVQAEYLRIWNDPDGRAASKMDAADFYTGVRFGELVPYGRYDVIEYPAQDPYFRTDDIRQTVFGLRYDLAAAAVLKGEARWIDEGAAATVTQFVVQVAVGF